MKLILTVAGLALLPFTTSAMDAKAVCEQLKPVVAELRTQLPQDVDYMTKLTGVQAIFLSGNCLLNYTYVVSASHFLEEMAAENQLSTEENLELLQTEDGINAVRSVFSDMAKNAAATHFAVFTTIPKIKITYNHSFDNPKIPSQNTVVLDNTQLPEMD